MSPTEIADRVAATDVDRLPDLLVELADDGDAAAFAAGLMRRRLARPATGAGFVVAICVTWPTLTTVACKSGLSDPLWFARLELHPDAIAERRWWVGPMTDEQLDRLDTVLPSQRTVIAAFDPADPPGYVGLVWELHRHKVEDPRAVALAVLADPSA